MLKDIYIFGASTNGEQCFKICREKGITVHGFLDNFTTKPEFNGVPVLRPADADRRLPVVVTSPTYAFDIWVQLIRLEFEVMNLSEFYRGLDREPPWKREMEEHCAEYEWLGNTVEDAKSVLVLKALMRYRMTFELFYPAVVNSGIESQWFDPEFFKPGPHVFVDGGAYDGDTAAEFIRRCPEYKAVHLFEPCKALAERSDLRLSAYRDIYVWGRGLSDTETVCHLENAGLPSGKIGPMGDEVSVLPLDTIRFSNPPTFIKLDIEGCEKQAIRGAEQTIRKYRPMLAIAVYHRPEDIWEIPKILSGMQDYKFFLRHYTQFYHETVLYAV